MIELTSDRLVFSFPEVHPEARLTITFQRTLRIPDDGKTYPLPPGLGKFPLRHVDDFSSKVPTSWITRGGILLPMYQSEALWIYFHSENIPKRDHAYPFAIKIAAGKINAVNGKTWDNELQAYPQGYVVVPGQPWIDGFCVEKGIIRQFVAMPLGSGYTVEEQLTNNAENGGLQIAVYPMLRNKFEKLFPEVPDREQYIMKDCCCCLPCAPMEMGLAPGGRMQQHIYGDDYGIECWDVAHTSRGFVHIANSLVWRSITGMDPPTVPFTAKEYTDAGLPWFDYYADGATALNGAASLAGVKSVAQMGKIKDDIPLPENDPVDPNTVIKIIKNWWGDSKDKVREGKF